MSQARLIIDESETNADLLWATGGFFVPDPCIFLQKGKRKYLVLSDLEYSRAQKEAAVNEVWSYSELQPLLKKRRTGRGSMADYVDAACRKLKVTRLEVPANFSLHYAEALKKMRYKISVGPEPFYPERAIKRADEVKAIQKAIRATERAISEGMETLRKSQIKAGRIYFRGKALTSERLRQVINVNLMEQGYVAKHTIVAGGKQASDPHCEGSGPLRAHQAIVMDVFPRSETTGYHADITRTVCKGKAPERLKEMYQAVHAAHQTAMKKIKHNVDAAKVHGAAVEVLEQRGWKTERKNGLLQGFIHSTGHGLGLDIHEYPRVSALKNKLVTGNVVTVEPGLYYPKLGGIRIEDDVLVTKTGYTCLSRLHRRFEIL